jgi:hypothetical protein
MKVFFFSGVITKGKGTKEVVCNDGSRCGSGCEAESEQHGTANLFRCTLSVVKSLSEKCLLHKYFLYNILAEPVMQNFPALLAHTRAL